MPDEIGSEASNRTSGLNGFVAASFLIGAVTCMDYVWQASYLDAYLKEFGIKLGDLNLSLEKLMLSNSHLLGVSFLFGVGLLTCLLIIQMLMRGKPKPRMTAMVTALFGIAFVAIVSVGNGICYESGTRGGKAELQSSSDSSTAFFVNGSNFNEYHLLYATDKFVIFYQTTETRALPNIEFVRVDSLPNFTTSRFTPHRTVITSRSAEPNTSSGTNAVPLHE